MQSPANQLVLMGLDVLGGDANDFIFCGHFDHAPVFFDLYYETSLQMSGIPSTMHKVYQLDMWVSNHSTYISGHSTVHLKGTAIGIYWAFVCA